MFSTAYRQNTMKYITDFLKENEHVSALVAVGSGSYGYNDELSDLDMVVAVDSAENIASVKEYVSSRLKNHLKLIYFKQAPYAPIQVYLDESFLEIDVGFGEYTRAAASKEHWKVIFDKTGTVDEAMRSSWQRIKAAQSTDVYKAKLAECSDCAWSYLMHSAVAIKRKEYWRAYAELELARKFLIELFGLRFSLDTERNRKIDQLPESQLSILSKTLVSELSQEALRRNLAELTDAIYDELETFGESAQIKVSREQINEYIDICGGK